MFCRARPGFPVDTNPWRWLPAQQAGFAGLQPVERAMRLSPRLLKTSLSFSLVSKPPKILSTVAQRAPVIRTPHRDFRMQAIEIPVADYCIRGGCGSLMF